MTNILSIPCKTNVKLDKILDLVNSDIELQTLWKCSNVLAMDRLDYNDHGPIHVKIVANGALKMLRLLVNKGVVPSVVKNYDLSVEDAEVIVVLASIMHDLGMAFVREEHEVYSVPLALDILKRILQDCYDEEERTIMYSEICHAIISHHAPNRPLTIEAGIVKVADALDMEQGRARIPHEKGRINIHSISAFSIEEVSIEEGENSPILITIEMSNPSGIFQVDNLLGAKVKDSGIEEYLKVKVVINEESVKRVIEL